MNRRMIVLTWWLLAATACSVAAAADPQCPQTTSDLYARIRSVTLDPRRVYRIRDASIDRPSLNIDLDDGTIAFTEDICGRITGAAFEGEGEIRLRPPNREERGSLALFTGMAILEEQFTSAYLRFNDDTATALQPFLAAAPDGEEFVTKWRDAARTLADFDALRLLLDFSHFLPVEVAERPAYSSVQSGDQKFPPLLHAHLLGTNLGAFEVIWDAANAEPLSAGQPRMKDGTLFFDSWTSFAPPGADSVAASPPADLSITNFRIRASVEPPTMLQASAEVNLRIRNGGERTLIFELSRYLKVESVEADAGPLDFVQNPAIEGTQLQRKGNDLVAVVLPAPLPPAKDLKLRFTYAGEVLSEAGNGLLYVGERGIWYPNFGFSPAQFELEFHYPASWTLVATGKKIASNADQEGETNEYQPGEKVSRWISERQIPVAGFNLGKYIRANAKAGKILVEAYGTKGVEKSFPRPSEVIEEPPFQSMTRSRPRSSAPLIITPPPPSPAHDLQAVADKAAKAIEDFSQWFGPYPFSSLALTQMPGNQSQGWPGLVFLSSFAFLSPQEQTDLHLDPVARAIDSQVLVHETAHQWWGDLVLWKGYRDQWLSEGLANYSSLLILEEQNPAQFRAVLEKYRRDLLSENKDGEPLRDAGPVTLGLRLESSHFPNGYEAISYERGTWLFHMLRSMLHDSALHNSATSRDSEPSRSRKPRERAPNSDEPFFRALRKIRERYAGKAISTQQLVQAFEEDLPRPLWYEKRPKLDWFLNGWIEGTSIPELESREIRITDKAGVTTATGVIVQKDAPDDLVTAIPVYASTSANTLVFLGEVLADGHDTAFRLIAPSNTRKIVLDPNQTILTAPGESRPLPLNEGH